MISEAVSASANFTEAVVNFPDNAKPIIPDSFNSCQ